MGWRTSWRIWRGVLRSLRIYYRNPARRAAMDRLYGRDRNVIIEPVAIGRESGTVALRLNIDNPTVSTASDAFVRAAHGAPGWQDQAWTETIQVPLTTLD